MRSFFPSISHYKHKIFNYWLEETGSRHLIRLRRAGHLELRDLIELLGVKNAAGLLV